MAPLTLNMGGTTMIYLIPFLNAAFGWFIIALLFRLLFHPLQKKNYFIVELQGFIPKQLPQWGRQAGIYASENLLNIGKLKENLLEPEKLTKINEILDDKVDDFLRNKLKDKIPLFGMFITDGLIQKMKETLMTELDQMIPELIGFFADDLEKKYDVQKMIAEKLAMYDAASLEKLFYQHAGKPILQLKIFVAVIGFLLGSLEMLLVMRF
ncbi:MAG: hypothetical protein IPO83_15865 [Chitinophagaceae bacterium]|nr:hypothetical protein [Chitinophagaceae bacterium]